MASPSEAATKTTVNLLLGGSSYVGAGFTSPLPPGGAPVTALLPISVISGQQGGTTPFDENQLFQFGSATVAFVLTVLMSIGIGLNCVLLFIVLFHPRVRQLVNAFIGHYAAISVLKCVFCIVFAASLTTRFETTLCDKIGGSYVVLTSVEVFNLLAMVCAEAYFFGQANVGRDGRGSCCCVMIGLFLIYLGSVILHLGPTIIAGGIGFNRTAGSCIFGFKSIQSYVAHAIWIVITTLGVTAVFYYLSVVYREVQSCRPHRIASLVRASVPTTTRGQQTVDHQTIKRIVSDSQRRAVVLILVTCTFVITSYPLFLLTLFDISFAIEGSIYRIFTFFSWTNTLINPILFLLVDRKFGLIRLLKPCSRLSLENDLSIVTGSSMASRRRPSYLLEQPQLPSSTTVTANNAAAAAMAAAAPPVPSAPHPAPAVSSGAVVNERTGLISKSAERIHFEDEEDEANNLGCSSVGLGASNSRLPKHQPPVVHEWQSRVGGRLYLQGEMVDADNNDDSVLMADGNPGTVIFYDRRNAQQQSSVVADQQQQNVKPANYATSSSRLTMGDFPSFSPSPQGVQMVSCLSAGSLAAGGQTSPPAVVSSNSNARLGYLAARNVNSNVNISPAGLYSNIGLASSGQQINRPKSVHQQQQQQQIFNSTSNDYLGQMVSSPTSAQQQASSVRVYRPQSTVDAIGKQHQTTSPSSMTLLAQQRQLQQQQLQQQLRQQQQQGHSVQLPTLRVIANSSNISFRSNNNNKNSGGLSVARPTLTTTASFIGTEDSLEEIVYSNSGHNLFNSNIVNNDNIDSGDLVDDEETTC